MAVKPSPVFQDIQEVLPRYRFKTVVDIGANIGQSSLSYAAAAPAARIYAIEPVEATFHRLQRAVRRRPNVVPIQALASSRSGSRRFFVKGRSTMNHVVAARGAQDGVITLPAIRTAELFAELRLRRISFLKVDTEGHDFEVLKGIDFDAVEIDFIDVECSMNPYNRYHVPFDRMRRFLGGKGYHLFKFYDQMLEWQDGGRPLLRRADAVFVTERLVKNLDRLAVR